MWPFVISMVFLLTNSLVSLVCIEFITACPCVPFRPHRALNHAAPRCQLIKLRPRPLTPRGHVLFMATVQIFTSIWQKLQFTKRNLDWIRVDSSRAENGCDDDERGEKSAAHLSDNNRLSTIIDIIYLHPPRWTLPYSRMFTHRYCQSTLTWRPLSEL